MLLDADWEGSSRLKVLCGGEAFPCELVAPLLERAGEVWNLYGPTETTIWSTVHRVCTEDRVVPVGRPLANTSLYILDATMRPVPIGASGDLYIGGDGLARGYLNRPALSAEKFIPDPFSGKPGMRLYKTGDMARYLSNGNIEFLGRVDHQIKIRGFRIELGEIETVLSQHPAIQEMVVLAREDNPGRRQLVAYVVSKQEHALTPNGLRKFLTQKLKNFYYF